MPLRNFACTWRIPIAIGIALLIEDFEKCVQFFIAFFIAELREVHAEFRGVSPRKYVVTY
jgi:hypothetical protein